MGQEADEDGPGDIFMEKTGRDKVGGAMHASFPLLGAEAADRRVARAVLCGNTARRG